MDEGRKRVILIAASILAARRSAQLGERSSPALETCTSEVIATAEKIMRKIDARWPTSHSGSQSKN
jgi:hypothetical protein